MLSVLDSAELRAAVLALKGANRDLRNDINRETTRVGNAIWRPAVERRARTALDRQVLTKGARVKGGNPPVAIAATSRKRLGRRGPIPAESWPGYEFGAVHGVFNTYDRKNRTTGGTHQVRRRTTNQLPKRYRNGRVLHQAFADVAPRMASLWVQMIVAKYNEAFEGGK